MNTRRRGRGQQAGGLFRERGVRCGLALGVLLLAASAAGAETIRHYSSEAAAARGLPFSQAVEVQGILYLSGQIGVPPGSMELVEGGIRAEARQAMENLGAVLEANGLGFSDVFKCTVMLADMGEWAAFNEVYVTYFEKGAYPARSAFGASGLALGGRLEIECMAAMREEPAAD